MLRPLLLACALAAPGCVVVADEPPNGTLTVRWSVEGTFAPSACARRAAANAQIVASGAAVRASCSAFAASVQLRRGLHRVSVSLLDAAGQPVSTTIELNAEIYGGYETFIDTEFPASSFF